MSGSLEIDVGGLMHYKIKNDNKEFIWDEYVNLLGIKIDESENVFPAACTYFEICGQSTALRAKENSEGNIVFTPAPISENRKKCIKSNEKFSEIGEDVCLKIEATEKGIALFAKCSGGFSENTKASMTLFIPDSAEIHLAENFHVGRKIDRSMPLEETFRCSLAYNMIIVKVWGIGLRFRTKDEFLRSTSVQIRKHDSTFALTFTWNAGTKLYLEPFYSYEDARHNFITWIEKDKKLLKINERSDVPEWLNKISLILTCDMLRSNWEIAHDYYDIIKAAKEIRKHRDPESVLFYIPGWQGAYDSSHPEYKPHDLIGGEKGFREMSESLHEMGYHIMIHTTVNGIDPYAKDVCEWEKSMHKDEQGKIMGWRLNKEFIPKTIPFRFRKENVEITRCDDNCFRASVGYVPGNCAAYVTVEGLLGFKGQLRVTHEKRSIVSPEGWFEENDLFDFIYPLQFPQGFAEVEVEAMGDKCDMVSHARLSIRDSLTNEGAFATWTYPIMLGCQEDSRYLEQISKNIAQTVEKYSIDAVHIDAASFYRPFEHRKIFHAIKDALPEETLVACEFLNTWEELGFHVLFQSAKEDLIKNTLVEKIIRDGGNGQPILEGAYEYYSWLNNVSDICDFSRDYYYCYPHLCAANSFVPVKKVCNILPARKLPFLDTEQWKMLRNAQRLGFIPGIRINYRDYGLDEQTTAALKELPYYD
jgi:hypothetical protein